MDEYGGTVGLVTLENVLEDNLSVRAAREGKAEAYNEKCRPEPRPKFEQILVHVLIAQLPFSRKSALGQG